MATIRDIAKESGVSAGAVSRILNNDVSLNVASDTRTRVLNIARQLNYIKKPRSNTPKKDTFTMGIMMWFTVEQELKDPYYLRLRQGVEDFCTRNNISIIRVYHDDADGIARMNQIDGLVCIGKFSGDEVEQYRQLCSNIIFLDMPLRSPEITSISMDFSAAVNDIMNYLTELGHTRIGYLGGREYVGGSRSLIDDPRTTAYEEYMDSHQLERRHIVRSGDFSSQSGYDMMNELFLANHVPTAIFAVSDSVAIGAMRSIQEHGLRIPEDISIVGFNDDDMSSYMNPPLTTINAPAYDMGQHGANLIFTASNLDTHTPLHIKLPCRLILRGSCAAPADHK